MVARDGAVAAETAPSSPLSTCDLRGNEPELGRALERARRREAAFSMLAPSLDSARDLNASVKNPTSLFLTDGRVSEPRETSRLPEPRSGVIRRHCYLFRQWFVAAALTPLGRQLHELHINPMVNWLGVSLWDNI